MVSQDGLILGVVLEVASRKMQDRKGACNAPPPNSERNSERNGRSPEMCAHKAK